VNLLDTPGHEDFSEDTYRTLTAVDSALMVIDGAKGVEERTIKLMNVCRLRDTPIISFVNKLDRPIRDAIELLDEIEEVLDIPAAPINWPIGMGDTFRGVYNLYTDTIHRFERGHNAVLPPDARIEGLDSDEARELLGEDYDDFLRRDRAGARCQPRLRSRGIPGRAPDAGVLRYGAGQLRRARDARQLRRVGAAAAAARGAAAHGAGRRGGVQRLRVQDPGEHGSPAPRPHRLPARLLRPLRERA
jgi:hypothetical protein